MKKFPFIARMLLLAASLIATSCSDGGPKTCQVPSVEGQKNNVIGKWKLMTMDRLMGRDGPVTIDLSCDNVIFHFMNDGTVTIHSDTEKYSDYGDEKLPYEWENPTLPATYGQLTINQLTWPAGVEEREMILDNSPLDWGRRILVRIE
ncbi:hypothetical protein HNQ92_005538 [Rhabdobacter roseus]|uniref:Lipocalin-like domain-containing protein n=1 Tax=Rhabdobacter roseus TaxID=1655419 RepID=A0A840TWR6_9BACT|nr:hypothetical protein [Rhabdobacter roseus]MBB5287375.1 hypothetical protein [Rhabdobacter roseus]